MIRWQETVRSGSGESFPQRAFGRGRGTGKCSPAGDGARGHPVAGGDPFSDVRGSEARSPQHRGRRARTILTALPEPTLVIDALPDRALTNEEAEQLKQQDSRIVPLSVLKGGDDPFVIYTMAFYRSEAGTVHLLGYSEEDGGWVQFESFPEDEWTVDRQENRVQQWVEEQYGDRFEQGMLDEESGTVDLG